MAALVEYREAYARRYSTSGFHNDRINSSISGAVISGISACG